MDKIQYWQFIPMEKRMQLRRDYKIKPSNPVSIENNRIVVDGISEGDLQTISLETLQEASGKIIKNVEEEKEETTSTEEEENEEVES